MKLFSTLLLSAAISAVSFAGAVTQAQAQAKTTANLTQAQMHTTNNVARYQKATTQHMSQYQRAACHKKGGVVIKTKTGSLVCAAAKK